MRTGGLEWLLLVPVAVWSLLTGHVALVLGLVALAVLRVSGIVVLPVAPVLAVAIARARARATQSSQPRPAG